MAKKKNKSCCRACSQTLRWIPVLFVVAIITWSYYTYVVVFCLDIVPADYRRTIYLIFFHIFFVPFIWSYLATILNSKASVPDRFKLPDADYELLVCAESDEIKRQILEVFAQNLPVITRTSKGGVRFCVKCQCVKPDRAHHCSVCGECVLKMDHHCPWINGCVNFNNYKCFFLYLFYSVVFSTYICGTTLSYVITYFQNDFKQPRQLTITFLFFVPLMFAISLSSLLIYHCFLIFKNQTTLEAFRAPIFYSGPDKRGFTLGACNNFQEVFGNDVKLWLIPIKSSLGDGCSFVRRYDEESTSLLSDTIFEN